MTTTAKTKSTDVPRFKRAHGKTPLERMYEVVELTRRCREFERLVHGRKLRVTDQDLIALKVDAGGPKDQADVIDLLRQNPDADIEAIRATCKKYGLDKIDALIEHARSKRR